MVKNRSFVKAMVVAILLVAALFYIKSNLDKRQETPGQAQGVYKKWEEITLEFTATHADLSQTSSNPNPFLDYKLTVIFAKSGKSVTVPGYFVGDGSGGSGKKWRAHFNADEEGTWNYTASLVSGGNVAVNGSGGTPIGISPASGSFSVSGESNLGGFYSYCGRLIYSNSHYLKCLKTGQSWIKGGSNSPENFINNIESPDIYQNALTVLSYLAEQKVNSIYFLPMNLGGDWKDTYPFVSETDITHYNVSKLTIWNNFFKEAMKREVSLEFVLNEQENSNREYLGLTLTDTRKLFYRELIARFSHHLAVRWIITEENKFPTTDLKAFAAFIRGLDPYDHPIAVHTNKDDLHFYHELLGDPNFDSASIQFTTIRNSYENASTFAQEWREKSTSAGRPWVVDMDEAIQEENAQVGMTKDNQNDMRKRVLYSSLFSGANISWYYGQEHDKGMSLWKFQDREPMWNWTWYARKLLYEFPNRANFRPGDTLKSASEVYYDPGRTYLVYMRGTSGTSNGSINLAEVNGQTLTLRWYNPRTGNYEGGTQTVTGSANVAISKSPLADAGDREDWVVVFQNQNAPPLPSPSNSPPPSVMAYHEQNGLLVIQPETKPVASGWTIESTVGGSTGQGYIKWTDPDYFSTPGNGLNEYKIYVTNPGNYAFRMRSNKKNPAADMDNDMWAKLDSGTWYKMANTNENINAWNWNTLQIITEPGSWASFNLSAGLHSFYISGRSNGFYLDRMHFFKVDQHNEAAGTNTSLPESSYQNTNTGGDTNTPLSCNQLSGNLLTYSLNGTNQGLLTPSAPDLKFNLTVGGSGIERTEICFAGRKNASGTQFTGTKCLRQVSPSTTYNYIGDPAVFTTVANSTSMQTPPANGLTYQYIATQLGMTELEKTYGIDWFVNVLTLDSLCEGGSGRLLSRATGQQIGICTVGNSCKSSLVIIPQNNQCAGVAISSASCSCTTAGMSCNITWTHVSGVASYAIAFDDDPNFWTDLTAGNEFGSNPWAETTTGGTQNTRTFTRALNNKQMYFTIRVYNAGTNGCIPCDGCYGATVSKGPLSCTGSSPSPSPRPTPRPTPAPSYPTSLSCASVGNNLYNYSVTKPAQNALTTIVPDLKYNLSATGNNIVRKEVCFSGRKNPDGSMRTAWKCLRHYNSSLLANYTGDPSVFGQQSQNSLLLPPANGLTYSFLSNQLGQTEKESVYGIDWGFNVYNDQYKCEGGSGRLISLTTFEVVGSCATHPSCVGYLRIPNAFTLEDLKQMMRNFFKQTDSLYQPVDQKINSLDFGWVRKWFQYP